MNLLRVLGRLQYLKKCFGRQCKSPPPKPGGAPASSNSPGNSLCRGSEHHERAASFDRGRTSLAACRKLGVRSRVQNTLEAYWVDRPIVTNRLSPSARNWRGENEPKPHSIFRRQHSVYRGWSVRLPYWPPTQRVGNRSWLHDLRSLAVATGGAPPGQATPAQIRLFGFPGRGSQAPPR